MLKPFLILTALVLSGVSVQTPQDPPASSPAPAESKIPLEAVHQPNPVRASAESLGRAKKIYGYECSICHGDDGGGGGDLAKNMKSKLPDFRDPSALKGQTDGEVFYIIKNGKGEMEGEGQRVKPENTWDLVNYVRSFSKLQAAAAAPGSS
jgi:mono/diheme cytochrome c family protein